MKEAKIRFTILHMKSLAETKGRKCIEKDKEEQPWYLKGAKTHEKIDVCT